LVYASSSSVYGDDPSTRKREDRIGRALSPYATSKLVDELYADVFNRVYGLEAVGLRYFNVFGPRQDPNGPYAAVIPRWTRQLLSGEPCPLFGDGAKTRDFCYVENVVQANLLAACAPLERLEQRVFNVACGQATRLDELYEMVRACVAETVPEARELELVREPARAGDIESSLAEIDRIQRSLGYAPLWDVAEGLARTVRWFASQGEARADRPSGISAMRGGELLVQTA
jgi:UDP-N-acetylglucosamine 4-epimerase